MFGQNAYIVCGNIFLFFFFWQYFSFGIHPFIFIIFSILFYLSLEVLWVFYASYFLKMFFLLILNMMTLPGPDPCRMVLQVNGTGLCACVNSLCLYFSSAILFLLWRTAYIPDDLSLFIPSSRRLTLENIPHLCDFSLSLTFPASWDLVKRWSRVLLPSE